MIENHRNDQHHAHRKGLPVRGDDREHSNRDTNDDDGTNNGLFNSPFTAGKSGTAQQNRDDTGKFHAIAGKRITQ